MDSDEDIDQESKIDGYIDNIWPNKQLTIMNTNNEVNQDDTNADIDHIEWLDHLPYVVQDAVYEYLQEIKRGLSDCKAGGVKEDVTNELPVCGVDSCLLLYYTNCFDQ